MSSKHDWNADLYHQVSDPQVAWGRTVLDRLTVNGDELVLDAGCGTGRLTRELIARLPDGRVVAADLSPEMLRGARRHLADLADRVAFTRVDLGRLCFRAAFDVVFSTATFHWVADHDALFAGIARALRPGGRLVAQCGGAGNLARVHTHCLHIAERPDFAGWFRDWRSPWEFATPEVTNERLARAGFSHARTWLEPTPVTFPERDAFRTFLTTVVIRPFVARLEDPKARDRFVETVIDHCLHDRPPLTFDYVRLNIDAVRG